MSQADVAEHFGITVRMIQYWEAHELLHPERPQLGRQRRYTVNDLVEIKFIKEMLIDQGYTVPALKEKLVCLDPPYYYDASDMFWDMTSRSWKSKADMAAGELSGKKALLTDLIAVTILDAGTAYDAHKLAMALLRTVDGCIKGRITKAKRTAKTQRKRSAGKKLPPAPLFEADDEAEDKA